MPKRHPVQREKDLENIAHRYLMLHEPQAVIAAALNVSQPTVSNDLKALVNRWQESALMDVDEAKAQELARINRLELEYWNTWEQSQRDKESTLAEKVTAPGRILKDAAGNERIQQDNRIKAVKRAEEQVGDPRFLAGVQWCIDRRCKLLGLDAPTKIAPTDPTGTKEYAELTDDERAERLAAILDTARARRDSVTSGRDATDAAQLSTAGDMPGGVSERGS